MVGRSSLNSEMNLKSMNTIKFLCSYGGLILPRYPDAKLRYHGGDTRFLSVRSSISFSDLLTKMGEMCGSPVSLRCQLPTEDLDALVSITSDEDLAHLIEEYERVATTLSIKIRAFLSAPKKLPSPPPSSATSPRSHLYSSHASIGVPPQCPSSTGGWSLRRPPAYPSIREKAHKHKCALQYYHHNSHGNGGNQ